ncbi:alanine racemase [Halomonas almeriensis]|uniref:alanine racemase n=1 Tax=Halomonas almeriensis TaxID=308163 RepID=UPI0025B30750|nr:alanine racemase [Halomonas almeriensis]MDN3553476.1 alanine racemase [Halomonas almeriensis]
MARPLTADIDLDALRHNYLLARDLAPQSRSMVVLKADAYGHGLVACARALADLAPAFAVACIEEAELLRDAGITTPIALLEGFFTADELTRIDELDLWTVVHSDWQVEALLAYRPARPLHVWVKVDSGMHRLGFMPGRVAVVWERLAGATQQVGDLHLVSHFATADQADTHDFQRQMGLLQRLADDLQAPTCLANSPATLSRPQSHADWNRPGVMLYGSDPLEVPNAFSQRLRPVMTLSSEIIAIRHLATGERVGYGGRWQAGRASRIAVVACGYGDGYDRHARDGTPVLVGGQRTELAGKVSMDMLTVDITDLPEADIGTEVTLWGRAANGEVLTVDEVARHCDTISYTLMTGVLPRVPRRYHDARPRV